MKAMKKYAIFALVLLASLSFARPPIEDPYMWAKYESTGCYAEFADDLIAYVQDLYDYNDPPAPDSLQGLRDDLSDQMDQLADYGIEGNRAAFDSQVRTVMSQVNLLKSTFRADARAAVLAEWTGVYADPSIRTDLRGFYGDSRKNLQSCLEGPE